MMVLKFRTSETHLDTECERRSAEPCLLLYYSLLRIKDTALKIKSSHNTTSAQW